MSTYRAIELRGKGGLDRLIEVQKPIAAPAPGEVRIRVRVCGAGYTDVIMRTGFYPYRPKFPFVPGYEVVGTVDAIGAGVTGLSVGQRVCALTIYGGYAEYLTREAAHFVPVPDAIDDVDACALILNYVTAYQMIHRSAQLRPGQRALVTGANGGVGTALLELLKLHGVRAVAAASPRHFDALRALGAEPIASRTQPLDELVQGVDASFDGLGGAILGQCVRATRRGGMVVAYGFTGGQVLRTFFTAFIGARLRGRRSTFYGITAIYRKDPRPFREDLPKLFALVAEGKLKPAIAARLPLLGGIEAQRMLEAGGLTGKVVLVAAGE